MIDPPLYAKCFEGLLVLFLLKTITKMHFWTSKDKLIKADLILPFQMDTLQQN